MSWVVSGRGGAVYAVGDEFNFEHVPLEGIDYGWEWRAPESLRVWTEQPVFESFENGRWLVVQPEKVYLRSGLAVFSRCISGHVRASGVCLPTSRLVDVGRWKVTVESVVPVGAVMGSGHTMVMRKQMGASVSLDVSVDLPGELFTWLPQGKCVVVGIGRVAMDGSTIVYDENGVSYDPCS